MKSLQLVRYGLAFMLLINGIDKFPQLLVDWSKYFPSDLLHFLHIPLWLVLYGSGIIEVLAGFLLILKPKLGGILAVFVFLSISISLIIVGDYYNVLVVNIGLLIISLSVVAME